MTSFQLGFHQDEDVLLNGNIVKTPPRSVGPCASGAQEMGERWIAGVCGGLHGVCGGRKADQFGLDSRKRFLRLGTQLQIGKHLVYLLAVCMAPTGCVTLGGYLKFGLHDVPSYPKESDKMASEVLQLCVQSSK